MLNVASDDFGVSGTSGVTTAEASCLVIYIVYVLVVPSSAVTTTLQVFLPTLKDLFPVPLTFAFESCA